MRSMSARVRAGSRNASNTARASAVVFVGPVVSAIPREGGVVALTVSVLELGVAMAAIALALPMRGTDAGAPFAAMVLGLDAGTTFGLPARGVGADATFAATAFLGSRVVMRARSP